MPSYSRKVQIPGKTAQQLYETVASHIDRFVDKAPAKFEIERDAERREVRLNSSMATATLVCREGEMEVEAKLSLFAAPFRSKIDEGINKWLSKTFNITV
jgi:hypothetical protein